LPEPPIWLSLDHIAYPILLLQIRERLGVSLGERPPTLVPVTHVMMCMNCGCDFSLTLRRHHCHACGKVSHRLDECGREQGLGLGGPEQDMFVATLRGGDCSHPPPPTHHLQCFHQSIYSDGPWKRKCSVMVKGPAHQKNREALAQNCPAAWATT
jgi:hypothetical protein